jgi:hypothetical protein
VEVWWDGGRAEAFEGEVVSGSFIVRSGVVLSFLHHFMAFFLERFCCMIGWLSGGLDAGRSMRGRMHLVLGIRTVRSEIPS